MPSRYENQGVGAHEINVEEARPLLESEDQVAKYHTPLPKLQVAALMLVILPESFTHTLVNPFITKLVKSLHSVKGGSESSVGYYTGLIESCFFMAATISLLFWAQISDKVGRKPVILMGSLGLAIALLCFGLSTSLLGVMVSRAFQGAINGNLGVVRAMLSEVTDPSNRAQAFAFAPVIWAAGATLGPLVGGMLANPAVRSPLFRNWFWFRYPYLLPCMAGGALSLIAFISTVALIKETRPSVGLMTRIMGVKPGTTLTSSGPLVLYGTTSTMIQSQPDPVAPGVPPIYSVLTRRLAAVLFNNALLGLLDYSFTALQAVFLATPVNSGGVGLEPSQIGTILGTAGFMHGVLQMTCFAPLYRRCNSKHLYTACLVSIMLAYTCFPALNSLARTGGFSQPGVYVLMVVQQLLIFPTYIGSGVMFIFVTNAAPTPALLGTTNGLASTVFASTGAVGPASVTSLFAISIERNLFGGTLVYVVMCGVAVTAVLASIYVLPAQSAEGVEAEHPFDR